MRYAIPLSLALLALPLLAIAQEPAAKPAPAIRSISEAQPPQTAQRPPLDPTAFCYFADRAYSLGAHMTDLVCAESNAGMMAVENGHKVLPRLEWKKAGE